MRQFNEQTKERRHNKVVEVLRKEIYEIFQREVKDPRVKKLTITSIELSPDLKNAKIYVCRFMSEDAQDPTQEQRDQMMAGLKSASHFVYEALKKRLGMKVIPTIRFEYDDSLRLSSEMWGRIKFN